MDTLNIDQTSLELVLGDITKLDVDAIVNAANTQLAGGGGVDGAIHRAAGPSLHAECMAIIDRQGRCPTGTAVTTSGGNLTARYVIHTVGPVWSGGARNEEQLLRAAYQSSLAQADEHQVASVAFPSISTGAYRYPAVDAARVAINAVIDYLAEHPNTALRRVIFVLFAQDAYDTYAALLATLGA